MEKKTVVLLILLFIVSSSGFLEASGFMPLGLSARVAALGEAFVALADDATAVFYNPAGLAFSSGTMLRTNIYYPKTTLTAEYPQLPSPSRSSLGKLQASYFVCTSIKDRISLGIGVFTPNAMDTYWPENWEGRIFSIHSKLSTQYIRPVVSVKISKFLSIGGGIDFISSDVTWKHEEILTFQDVGSDFSLSVTSESNVKGKGTGYVAGILVRINDNLRIGGRYQEKVELDLAGSQSFLFDRYSAGLTVFGVTQDVTSSLTIPREFVLGIIYSPRNDLTLQLDFQRTGMSDIHQWEFDFDPQFYETVEGIYGMRPDDIRDGVDLDLIDISRIMLGVEYRIKEFIAIRAGYSYQKSAISGQVIHPAFPDLGTNVLSFGIGYDGPAFSIWDYEESIGGISLDVFFQYGFSSKSPSSLSAFPATYQASRWNLGLGLGFTFGSL